MNYYHSRAVNLSFDEAIAKVTKELKKEGFGVLTEIDVRETLKKKLDVDFRRYRILGACNPPFAYKALQAEKNIGALLPCNFVVQETEDGRVDISAVNPVVSMQNVKNPALEPVAKEINDKILRILEAV